MSGTVVPLALAAIVLGGLLLVVRLMARRPRAGHSARHADLGGRPMPAYSAFSSFGAQTGLEDPLIAAIALAADERSGGSSRKVGGAGRGAGGRDRARWVRRLDSLVSDTSAGERLDGDTLACEAGVDAEFD